MDRFTRNYLVGLGALALLGLIGWAVPIDCRAAASNDLLREDPLVDAYPYALRVRAVAWPRC